MLDAPSLASFLLDRGLLDVRTIVEGEVAIRPASRRNHNFEVVAMPGASYFVKQGVDADTRATIEREAAIYRLLTTQRSHRSVAPYVPGLIEFAADDSILVLELVPNALNLAEYLLKRRAPASSVGRQLGRGLAALHGVAPPPELETGADDLPWVLAFPDITLEALRELSAGSVELIRVTQRFDGFRELLGGLEEEWTPDALIHADLKAGNCLLSLGPGRRRFTGVSIIDWELARVGDPCWDIGSVFADYLSTWVFSIPIASDIPVERFPQLARYPLTAIQPAMRAFWDAYAASAQPADEIALHRLLLRSVKYAAARLTQTAYEQSQGTTALAGTALCLLQLAWNMIKRPVEAIVWLLGLRMPDPRPAT